MHFTEIECSEAVADKLQTKHGVELSEVHEVLENDPQARRAGPELYSVSGRADSGRYLLILLHDLGDGVGRLVTAREMNASERRAHRKR
ncbi:MAG: hypothetical protein KKI08_22630 [Armatimonadetes bacterium]|nr:hypothetical protein [Armatimonadota bacterium]